MRTWRCVQSTSRAKRCFTTTASRRLVKDLAQLPDRVHPSFEETSSHDLLALRWPSPPRNVLLVCKEDDTTVTDALIEYAQHIQSSYPDVSLIFEPDVAQKVHTAFSCPVYTPDSVSKICYHEKVDITSTLGGDGTILHAASLFATAKSVPPVLSFSMGTLGFLGEWKFHEYKRAFREAYMSGAPSPLPAETTTTITDGGSGPRQTTTTTTTTTPSASGWAHSHLRGKYLGHSRSSRILLRNRLRIGLYNTSNQRLPTASPFTNQSSTTNPQDIFALNEVLLHRGALPHLSHITILIGSPPHQRTLTTAIADGFLISTPTGSTAYSLSSGGSIVHPLVPAILLTPICPRSLSFRPLVLPANTPVTLRIDQANRGKEIEVSVDGVRRDEGLKAGMEVRVVGEDLRHQGGWGGGGVPSIVRGAGREAEGRGEEDHWVGGLNGLLKFNYPFGEDG